VLSKHFLFAYGGLRCARPALIIKNQSDAHLTHPTALSQIPFKRHTNPLSMF